MSNIQSNYLPGSFTTQGGLTEGVSRPQAEMVAGGVQARIDQMPTVQDAAFLALLKASDFAPADLDTQEEVDQVLDRLMGAAAQIADAVNSLGEGGTAFGTSASFLARAMIEFAAEQRKNALDNRLQAREEAKTALQSQANEMRESASKMMIGAVVSLVVSVVMAAVSIGMSAAATLQTGKLSKSMASEIDMELPKLPKPSFMRSSTPDAPEVTAPKIQAPKDTTVDLPKVDTPDTPKATKPLDDGVELPKVDDKSGKGSKSTKPDDDATTPPNDAVDLDRKFKFDTLNMAGSRWQSIGTIGGSVNQVGQSVSGASSGMTQAQGKLDEAEGSEDAARAQEAEAAGEIEKNLQQTMDEFIKSIVNFLKELKEAEVDQMRALTKL